MTDAAKALSNSVRELAPAISARSAEIESARRLPSDLLADLRSAGFFRMFVPKSYGGIELDVPASMELIETLATADGSTGWVVMIGCETPMLLALLSRKRFDELYADGPDLLLAGGFAPKGEAALLDGAHRVKGRWGFASGCQHSQWLLGNCVVTENGLPRPGAAPGTPELRAMMFAPREAAIIDTWSVSGLRGTGSHDIAVDQILVPAENSLDIFTGKSSIAAPAFLEPILYFAMHIAAVGVGIAQRALQEIIALASTNKRRLYAPSAFADSPLFQYRLGHAETTLRSARMLLRNEAESVWASAVAGREASQAERCRVTGTISWVAHTSATVVDVCYTAGGGSSLYESSPLQRCLRDIHTLTQHAAVAEAWLTRAGASLMGRMGARGSDGGVV